MLLRKRDKNRVQANKWYDNTPDPCREQGFSSVSSLGQERNKKREEREKPRRPTLDSGFCRWLLRSQARCFSSPCLHCPSCPGLSGPQIPWHGDQPFLHPSPAFGIMCSDLKAWKGADTVVAQLSQPRNGSAADPSPTPLMPSGHEKTPRAHAFTARSSERAHRGSDC